MAPDQPGTTRPSQATRDEEARDAGVAHEADREPTKEEAALADEHDLNPETAKHEREMAERGANQRGEGRVP